MTTKTIESAAAHSVKVLTVTDLDGKIVGLDIQNEDDELTINVKRADLLYTLGITDAIDHLNSIEFLLTRVIETPGVPSHIRADVFNAHKVLLQVFQVVNP